MTKVLISMPDDLLERIDREVKARRLTRSRFLEEAARHVLANPSADAVDVAVAAARQALAGAGEFESSAIIRADREARDAARN